MKTIKVCALEPIKYLRQEPGQEGTALIIDHSWIPDLDFEYVTTINISDESNDEQAIAEIMTICSIHCAGKLDLVSCNCPKLVAVIATIYNTQIKEMT